MKWEESVTSTGFRPEVVPLSVADMEFKACPEIVQGIKDAADTGVFGYTYNPPGFMDALVNWMKNRHDWEVKPEWVEQTWGVILALYNCIRSYSEEGDKVIIQTPVYYPFFDAIRDTGRELVESPLKLVDGHYEMDYEDFAEKAKDAKMVLFCSPHNPVGRVWTREELERVAEICLKYNVTWMVDEMHCDFIFPGHTFTSCMNLDEKYRQILALYSSPGKTFNVAGLQPANIIIPNEELRKKYQWANTQAAYSQGSLMGQLAVKVCYTKGAEWVDELVQYIYENVQYMSKFVKENFPKAKMVEPEGTYLVWVDFSGYGFSNEELEHLMLEEAKLWLDSGIIFGPETAQFERFNVACPRVTLEQALTQLKDALDKYLAAK